MDTLVPIVFVRRITTRVSVKLGGFDNILSALKILESNHFFVEMPLGRNDFYRFSYVSSSKKRSIQIKLGAIPQSFRFLIFDPLFYVLTLLFALVITRGKILVMSADLGVITILSVFQKLFPTIRLWHHVVDFTPGKRFDNDLINKVYELNSKHVWLKADEITTPSKKIESALNMRYGQRSKSTTIIRNLPDLDNARQRQIEPRRPGEDLNVILAGSEVTPQFLVHETISALSKVSSVFSMHLIVLGRALDKDYIRTAFEIADISETPLTLEFPGMVSLDKVEMYLSKSDLGLAFYDAQESTFSSYGDSLKVWHYVAHRIPVLGSDFVSPLDELVSLGGSIKIDSLDKLTTVVSEWDSIDHETGLEICQKYYYENVATNAHQINNLNLRLFRS